MPKDVKSKPAGKQKIQAGSKGGMHNFEGVGTQKPGVSAVNKGATTGKFAKGGPKGGMHGFSGVKAQKSGRSGQS